MNSPIAAKIYIFVKIVAKNTFLTYKAMP